MQLRLVDDGPADPAWNMALDEALLRQAAVPTLRLYGWRPHAVSLGYFQPAGMFADLRLPVVRRTTGGGAIHHADECTFSLALDAGLLPADVESSYVLLHDAVAAALRSVGVPASRLAAGPLPHARPATRWCFASTGRHDLVAGGSKLVGSAQRRLRRPRARVLHHGSIVLRRPALTPFAAAVADFVPPDAVAQELGRQLAARIGAALGLEPAAGRVTAAEAALAAALAAERYGAASFVQSR